MKTAVASPDDGAPKKKYGIPEKDKKGLKKKQDYTSTNERYHKKAGDSGMNNVPSNKRKMSEKQDPSQKHKDKFMAKRIKDESRPKPKGTGPSPSQDNMHKNAAKKVDSIVHMKGYIVKPMKARKKEDLEKAKDKSPSTSKGKKK